MGNTINSNILFVFSNASLGAYRFEQNPSSMDTPQMKVFNNILPILIGEDICQRAVRDNEVRKMTWDITSHRNYVMLKRYAARNSRGVIPITYFWDGPVNQFQGAPIQVIDVYGAPIAGKFNQWRVEIQFKPAVLFDRTMGQ